MKMIIILLGFVFAMGITTANAQFSPTKTDKKTAARSKVVLSNHHKYSMMPHKSTIKKNSKNKQSLKSFRTNPAKKMSRKKAVQDDWGK